MYTISQTNILIKFVFLKKLNCMKLYVIQESLECTALFGLEICHRYSLDVKQMNYACPINAEIQLQFLNNSYNHLIKATSRFECLNIDFNGPIPSVLQNRFILTTVNEFSICFPTS